MSLNPLAPVTDYQSMLNRIFWFTTASALAAMWVLRRYIPGLDAALRGVDFSFQFGGDKLLPVPGGYLLPAFAVGMLARVYRIHTRLADWLGIRECFDVDVIISELAAQLAIDLSPFERAELARHRHEIMRKSFYAFVSATQPQIDLQLVQQALDSWSWFWIGLNATLVFVLTGLGLVAAREYSLGLETMGTALFLAAIGLPAMLMQCQRFGVAQVRAILADPARAAVARAALAELTVGPIVPRQAA